jgi:hypothetical protein
LIKFLCLCQKNNIFSCIVQFWKEDKDVMSTSRSGLKYTRHERCIGDIQNLLLNLDMDKFVFCVSLLCAL